MQQESQLNNHPCLAFETNMQQLAKPLFKAYDFNYFGHARILANGEHTGLTSNCHLAKYWFEQKFPLLGTQQMLLNNIGILGKYFNSAMVLPEGMYFVTHTLASFLPCGMLNNLRLNFNIDHLVLIIKKYPLYADMYLLTAPPEKKMIIHILLNQRDKIYRFLLNYEQKSKKIMQQVIRQTLRLPIQISLEQQKNTSKAELDLLTSQAQSNFFLKLNDQLYQLTKREKQCTDALCYGYSYRQIADLLHISHRTVESHLEKVKQKLNCRNKKELIHLLHSNEDLN